jgi:hypothetical protein
MRRPSFSTDPLLRFLRVNKIASLPDLQRALGSQVPPTVFRKLKELGYRTSYSQRVRFCTLDRIARFSSRCRIPCCSVSPGGSSPACTGMAPAARLHVSTN